MMGGLGLIYTYEMGTMSIYNKYNSVNSSIVEPLIETIKLGGPIIVKCK